MLFSSPSHCSPFLLYFFLPLLHLLKAIFSLQELTQILLSLFIFPDIAELECVIFYFKFWWFYFVIHFVIHQRIEGNKNTCPRPKKNEDTMECECQNIAESFSTVITISRIDNYHPQVAGSLASTKYQIPDPLLEFLFRQMKPLSIQSSHQKSRIYHLSFP